jgi:hypothetical protein
LIQTPVPQKKRWGMVTTQSKHMCDWNLQWNQCGEIQWQTS